MIKEDYFGDWSGVDETKAERESETAYWLGYRKGNTVAGYCAPMNPYVYGTSMYYEWEEGRLDGIREYGRRTQFNNKINKIEKSSYDYA